MTRGGPASDGPMAFLRSDAALAMAARTTQGAAMAVAALFVVWRLSPVEQGFYFAFISFGILLQLCDFGLSYASLQAASHLLAIGRAHELGALASRALRINASVTTVATVVVAGLGWWIFSQASVDDRYGWALPWLVFVTGVGANHLTAPWIFIVEGGVSVSRAWRFRLFQESIAGATLFAVLSFGPGLWALAAYFWMRCAVALVWMRRAPLSATQSVTDLPATPLTGRWWRKELWPFQWRVGLSAISGYLVFQAFGPILFALRGPVEAGRFALSLAVMNAIVMVTTAWPISQAAHFGVLLGRRQIELLGTRWMRLLLRSTAFATVGAAATVVLFLAAREFEPRIASRFAGPLATSLLIASAVAHHVIACISVVLRSERRDPLLWLGIVGGVVTVGAMTIAADTSADGLDRVALVYLVSIVATLPIAWLVLRAFTRRQSSLGA